jgi:hypothetical protein
LARAIGGSQLLLAFEIARGAFEISVYVYVGIGNKKSKNWFYVAGSQPPRISMWYLLEHLGLFSRQQQVR